jgi:hypothetical protein
MVGAGDFKISALGWDFYGFILGHIIYIFQRKQMRQMRVSQGIYRKKIL